MKKRILAILLASVMLFALLAACSNDPPEPPAPPDSPAPDTSTPATTTDDDDDDETAEPVADNRGQAGLGWNPLDYGGAFVPFDSPVTLQIGTFDRARDDMPPVGDNYWTQWVNEYFGENLNINVEYIPIDRSNTMIAYNLLFAAQTPPTILMEYDFEKVTEWWVEGALQEIDRAQMQEIAPTWVETSGGMDWWDQFMVGGGTFFAPAYRPFWDTNFTWVTFYRLDWYEEQDLGRPTSYEEWIEAQLTFKEAYNLPYTLDHMAFTHNFQFYDYNPFPLDEEYWAMYSCVNVPSLPAEGARRHLAQLNQQYNLGLINPEFELDEGGAGAQTEALQAFINGNLYRYSFFAQASMPDLEAFYENNPDAKLGIMWNNTVNYAMGDELGYRQYPQERATNPAGFFLGFSSSASDDELKAAYMYLEWMAQPDVLDYFQWGAEGVTFNYNDNGDRVMVSWEEQGDMWMGFSSNKDYWAVVVEARVTGDAETTAVNIIPANLPDSPRLRQEQADRYAYLRVRANHGLTYNDPINGSPIVPGVIAENRPGLIPLFQSLATDLVKANPDNFESMYEDAVQRYRDAGYSEIEAARLQSFRDGYIAPLNPIASGAQPFSWWPVGSVISTVYD